MIARLPTTSSLINAQEDPISNFPESQTYYMKLNLLCEAMPWVGGKLPRRANEYREARKRANIEKLLELARSGAPRPRRTVSNARSYAEPFLSQ